MSKSSPRFSSSQITIFLMSMIATGALFFYVGARFGAKIHRVTDQALSGSLLPDEKMDQEIQQMLALGRQNLKFHQLLQSENPPEEILPKPDPTLSLDRAALLKQHDESVKISDTQTSSAISLATAKGKSTSTAKTKSTTTTTVRSTATQTSVETIPSTQTATAIKSSARFRLQIGSYSDESKAKADVSLWQKRGFTAKIVKSILPGKGTWYRLHIGGYTTLDEAKLAQGDVMKKYGKSPVIAPVD